MEKTRDERRGARFVINFACVCLILIPALSDYICVAVTPVLFFGCKRNGHTFLKYSKKSPVTYSFALFLILQFINIFRSSHKVASLGFSLLWAVLFLGYLAVSEIASNKIRIQKLMFAGTISGGITGGIGIVQMVLYHFGGMINKKLTTMFNPFWDIFHRLVVKAMVKIMPQSFASQFGVNLQTVKVLRFPTRACSTFSNPIFFAAFLVICLPIALHCFFQIKENIGRRIICGICVALILGGIALSYTRGAYLASLLAIFITLFCEKKQTEITLLLTPVALLLIPGGVYKRLLSLTEKSADVSLSTHGKIYQAAFETIKENWLFGIGTGNDSFEDILKNKYGINQPHAHNIFLELFIEGGILGITLFVITLALMCIGLIRIAVKVKDGRSVGVTLLASLAGFICCGMFDYVFYGPKPIQIFMILTGLIEATCRVWMKSSKPLLSEIPDEVVSV